MSVNKDEGISAEELRKRLYQRFKEKGVLDAVKTQLRTQMIIDLQQQSLPYMTSEKSQSLSLLATNSLVIQHLQSSGYEYTLSVFYPECGMSKEKVLATRDVLQLLRISPESQVYQHLVADNHSGQKGLLINLLSELIDHRLQTRVCDADTQTSDTSDSIVRKMQMIDEEYELLKQRGQSWASVEGKLAKYRKQMEEQAEAELKSKIQHFQEVEISRMRMEEREKYQQELMKVRQKLERNYEMKSEALMTREKNAIERLQRQQQIEEREMYSQRQALLKEIESVHHREAELRHRMETFQKSCKLHEEKMKTSEELLRKRELDVRKMEEMYDLKLNGEIRKHQLELDEDYSRRTEALTESENRNKEETARIQREAAIINAKTEEHQRVMRELVRVQEELASARGSVCMLEQQNATLKEKLDSKRDYTTIQNQRMELQTEVQMLKKQLEESQEEKQRLQQELKTPSPELLALQVELRKMEAARRLDQDEFQNQKQVFHSQLSQEVERCTRLKAQLLECEERTRWMSTQTEDLKQQLRHTQQALENEVLRNPKPSLVDPSVLHVNPASVASTDEGYLDNFCDPGLATRRRRHSRTEGEEAVAAAWHRFQELEKEAESLEEAYRSYRRKKVVPQTPFKATSSPPSCAPVTLFRPITAAKTRVVAEEGYTGTELNQRLPGHLTPPTVGSPPLRRLSSTPVSTFKTKPGAHTKQEVLFSGLSSQREVSPIPMVTSEVYTHITPPSSPNLKSTAWDNYSSPKLQEGFSSSQGSSPQPEKICTQDLTSPQTDFPNSLEQHRHQQTEETHTHVEQHGVVQPAAQKKQEEEERRMKEEEERRMKEEEERRMKEEEERRIKVEEERRMKVEEERRMKEEEERRMKEEEEERWQEERRLKEERRLQEREEAQERERRELERLQLKLQENLPDPEEEEKQETGGATEILEEKSEVKTEEMARGGEEEREEVQDDPLHRYMLMMMQGREREKKQTKDESESPQPMVLSDHKDDSVTSFSHEDADEDDFW